MDRQGNEPKNKGRNKGKEPDNQQRQSRTNDKMKQKTPEKVQESKRSWSLNHVYGDTTPPPNVSKVTAAIQITGTRDSLTSEVCTANRNGKNNETEIIKSSQPMNNSDNNSSTPSLFSSQSQLQVSCDSLSLQSPTTNLATPNSQMMSKYCKIVNDLASTLGATPKRFKTENLTQDEVTIENAKKISGCLTVKAKVVEKTNEDDSELILRIADLSGYIDLYFDSTTSLEFKRLRNTSYMFKNVVMDAISGRLQYFKSSRIMKVRMDVEVCEDVPKLRAGETVVQCQETATIDQLFQNAELRKAASPSGDYSLKGSITGIVTQKYKIPKLSDKSPACAYTIIDKNLDSVKVKLYQQQAEKLENSIKVDSAYVFNDFNVRLEDGKNERCFLSTYSSTAVPTTVDFVLPSNVGKLFIIGVNVGSFRVYKVCPREPCKSQRIMVDNTTNVCYKKNCKHYVGEQEALAGFSVEAVVATNVNDSETNIYLLYDESIRSLINIDENLKFNNVTEKELANFESRLEDTWEIAGETGQTRGGKDLFNIRFAQKYMM